MKSKVEAVFKNLGISCTYVGYFYGTLAVTIALQDIERLLHVTEQIYQEVASQYDTTVGSVERGIRYVINIAWKENPQLLVHIAGKTLHGKPTCAQFIAMIATHILQESAA